MLSDSGFDQITLLILTCDTYFGGLFLLFVCKHMNSGLWVPEWGYLHHMNLIWYMKPCIAD